MHAGFEMFFLPDYLLCSAPLLISSFRIHWSGVGGADAAELRRIVSEPHEEHLLLGTHYSALENVMARLSRRVCVTASEPPRPVKVLPTGEWINMSHTMWKQKSKSKLWFSAILHFHYYISCWYCKFLSLSQVFVSVCACSQSASGGPPRPAG